MTKYLVHVAIVLKGSRDPEGETIYQNVVLSGGFTNVSRVRSGKYLGFEVEAQNEEEAVRLVQDLCFKLRIYNPTVHRLIVLGVENA